MAKKRKGRPWVTDAQELNDQESLVRTQESILFRTTAVDDFLTDESLASRAIVGSKGFGKTFVLKLKRLSLQNAGYLCVPRDPPVDRMSGGPPFLSYESAKLLTSASAWSALWELSIMISVVKAAALEDDRYETLPDTVISELGPGTVSSIMADASLNRPFAIIHKLLLLERSRLEPVIDQAPILADRIGSIHRQIAVFIDNIDEYGDRLRDQCELPDPRAHFVPDIWHAAQIGAWRAVRQLQGINPRLRIFVSIRRESFHHAQKTDTQFPNLRAFHMELQYQSSDIERIIENNIRSEIVRKLAAPKELDYITRFLGVTALAITNKGTGSTERVIDYWMRHCTGRPRDAVVIGGAISQIPPKLRNEETVRNAINEAGAELIHDLFVEAKTQVPEFDGDKLCASIKTNVLSKVEVLQIEEELRLAGESAGSTVITTFSHFHALGLIGVVKSEETNGLQYQYFEKIGSQDLSNPTDLPNSEYYLIHPSLSDYIAKSDATFHDRLDRYNIVGHRRRWESRDHFLFCAIGDVVKYSQIALASGTGSTWNQYFQRQVRMAAGPGMGLQLADQGDRVTFASPNPDKVISACRRLAVALKTSPYEVDIRFGGHSGFWVLQSLAQQQLSSEVPIVAARALENATAGTLCVTEDFVKSIRENEKLRGSFLAKDEYGQAEHVIGKPHDGLPPFRLFEHSLRAE